MPALCIYVGDSGDVLRRLTTDHGAGNVEASALRRHIAEEMGYELTRTKRASGNTRIRIAAPNERSGELRVTEYIRSGRWKYVLCASYDEASDFQWFVIERLNPLTNRRRGAWRRPELPRYEALLGALQASPPTEGGKLSGLKSGPGVYVLDHDRPPRSKEVPAQLCADARGARPEV
ncbi:MAG TPA: hypothetical protein VGM69_08535 [Chloroflexota bacterium]|jgi:hypothetical protein